MDIVLVLTTGEGGMPHYTAELANSLHNEGNDVTIIKPNDTTADNLFDDGITVEEILKNPNLSFTDIYNLDLSPVEVFSACMSLRKISTIPDMDPDIVHFTHKPHSYLWPFIPDIDEQVPVVVTRHDTKGDNLLRLPGRDLPLNEDPKVVTAMNIEVMLQTLFSGVAADGYIAHTGDHTDDLMRRNPNKPVATIPHGSFTIFNPDSDLSSESADEISTDGKTILFFGTIDRRKEPYQLVKATVKAADEIDGLTTVIAGSGTLRDQTKEIIQENPSLFAVKNEFIPNTEVSSLFAKADVVAVPHREQKGHSGTMTIAFSHGKPVLATNVGEFDDLILKSGAGYVVDPDDVHAMKNAICSLFTNSALREEMSHNSKAMAESLSWETVAEDTTDFYKKVIQSKDK